MAHNHTSESWSEADQQASEPDFYGKWVSVKTELPAGAWSPNHDHLSLEVLVFNGLEIAVAFYDRNSRVWLTGEPYEREWIDSVSHWMPLPPPPKDK